MARNQHKDSKEIATMPPLVIRSSAGLRDALFDEMDRMRQNKTSATNANAMAKLAATIVDSVEMEVAVRRFMHDLGDENGEKDWRMPRPIALGEKGERKIG